MDLFKTDLSAPCRIEYEATVEQLGKMLSHIKKVWTDYGDDNPFWSVITSEKFSKENICDESKLEFYESGKESCKYLTDSLARNDIQIDKISSCLEFGCGTGRVTCHLAELFHEVIACDISKPHIELAQEYISCSGNDNNITFKAIYAPSELSEVTRGVDLVFSVIVLQHNPPPLIAEYLEALLRLLNPGGLAFFQIPTYKQSYCFSIKDYLRNIRKIDYMEVHALPQKVVFEVIRRNNCVVYEVREDAWVGDEATISNTFLVQRGD